MERNNYRSLVAECKHSGVPIKHYSGVLLTQYFAGDKIEKNEMVGACSKYGGGERCVQGFGGENWEKEITGETQAYMGG
jgi:hypothetical protein